jgi:outer membrane receptor protein involved in Fe transport
LNATLQTTFNENSPSHPRANENGEILALRGSRLPGLPENMVKLALDYDILPSWTLGMNMLYNGDQFLRGDTANLADPLASYVLFNLKTEYRFNEHIALFGKLNNVFDQRYQNFGTYGNTGDVLESALGIDDVNSRFVGVGAPRAGWVGVRISM